MTTPVKRSSLFFLRLLLVGVLFAALTGLVDFTGALAVLARIQPLWLVPVLGLFGLGQILSCVRWRLSLAQMTASPPPILALLRLYLIGMFVNLGIPTMAGGDIARAELARGLTGNRGSAYASVLADRLIGAFAVVVVAFSALFLSSGIVDGQTRSIATFAGLVLLIGLAVTTLALHLTGGTRGWRHLDPFFEALRSLATRPRIVALSLLIAITVQVVGAVLPIAMIAYAMGIHVPLAVHLVLVPVIALVTLVPVAPGGIGVRETSFVLLYGQFGIQAEAAFALGLGWSLVLIAYGLAGGVLLLCGKARADASP